MRNKLFLLTIVTGLTLTAQIPDFRPPTPLFGAIMKNDAQAVRKLLAEGADPNQGQFFGQTPLVLAINNSNVPVVRELLQRGADVKATDQHGSTTLMRAVASETPDMALIADLIQRGVDPNVQNKLGETALSMAVKRGDMKTVERLKAAGASDTAAVREAVEKAVASLQKSGPQFVKVSGCVSCHHQSVPQIAYAAARQRGYKLDEAISTQQVKAVMALVRPIRQLLEKDAIALPNPGISISYLLLGLHAEGYAPDETTAAMALAVQRTQLPDGSFAVAGSRPPMEFSPFTSTALSIRALQLYGKDPEARIAAARQWLEQRSNPATQEERAMRLLGLAWAKADARVVERATADLSNGRLCDRSGAVRAESGRDRDGKPGLPKGNRVPAPHPTR
jgi:hypothetical protein